MGGHYTACAPRIAPVHTVGTYPLHLANAVPATAGAGNKAGRQALQAAAVAIAAVADEISRSPELAGSDLGLRGGSVALSGGNVMTITLRAVRWVTDATINGTAAFNELTGTVVAHLTVHPAHGAAVSVNAGWNVFGTADAVIGGSQGGKHMAARSPAP